jgi:hypothetical protein
MKLSLKLGIIIGKMQLKLERLKSHVGGVNSIHNNARLHLF